MGKRTNPLGFRTSYSEKWTTQILGPSYMDRNIQSVNDMLTVALYKILSGYKVTVSWVCIVNTGFFLEVHIFVDHSPEFQEDLEITRKLRVVFKKPIKLRYHCLGGWLKKSPGRHKKLRISLGRHWRIRHNRFFFRISGLTQLGFACLDASLLTKAVKDMFLKHNRHWLVFKFLKTALRAYVDKDPYIVGMKLQIAGKINGFSRKRRKIMRVGPLPLQSVSNNVDYSYRVAVTKFGTFGIKLWLFKGQKYL